MAANIEKIKICFRAVILFVKNVLSLKFLLWLWLAAFLVAVLLTWLVACTVQENPNKVDSAVVGMTEYNGHGYLVFYSCCCFSVIHDPDCICNLIED